VRHLLEAALAHEGVGRSVEDVLEKIKTGHAQMWAGKAAFHITEIIIYPNRKTLHVWLSGGDMEELIEMAPKLMAWGKSMGCSFASIEGRTGWERKLAPMGFRKEAVLLGMAL
jgi:hypothetical protein